MQKFALLSVSDKTGIVEFAEALVNEFGYTLLSTGGTAKLLRDQGIPVTDVSDHTKFPEMMDGRVKTLHPRIHGGLLCLRDNPEHLKAATDHDIEMIDLVVVNLYPFEDTVARANVTFEEAIEQINDGKLKKNYLEKAISTLNEREKIIIKLRKLKEKSITLDELGKMLKISKERVRQIETKALEKLKTAITDISQQNKEFFV